MESSRTERRRAMKSRRYMGLRIRISHCWYETKVQKRTSGNADINSAINGTAWA
jgi:hypothetical protein